MSETRIVIVVFYMDDVQVLYHKKDEAEALEIIAGLHKAYDLHNLRDIEWFLGIRVIRDRKLHKLWLVHNTYIEKMATKFGIDEGKTLYTPLPSIELWKFEGEASLA